MILMWLIDFLLKRKQLIFLAKNWEIINFFEWDEKIPNPKMILDWEDKKERRDVMNKTDIIVRVKVVRAWE